MRCSLAFAILVSGRTICQVESARPSDPENATANNGASHLLNFSNAAEKHAWEKTLAVNAQGASDIRHVRTSHYSEETAAGKLPSPPQASVSLIDLGSDEDDKDNHIPKRPLFRPNHADPILRPSLGMRAGQAGRGRGTGAQLGLRVARTQPSPRKSRPPPKPKPASRPPEPEPPPPPEPMQFEKEDEEEEEEERHEVPSEPPPPSARLDEEEEEEEDLGETEPAGLPLPREPSGIGNPNHHFRATIDTEPALVKGVQGYVDGASEAAKKAGALYTALHYVGAVSDLQKGHLDELDEKASQAKNRSEQEVQDQANKYAGAFVRYQIMGPKSFLPTAGKWDAFASIMTKRPDDPK